jgi:cobalt/nickel transport protein
MDRYVYIGLALCLLVAGAMSLFASPEPDGLERVAEDSGFAEHGEDAVFEAPFPDYAVPGLGDDVVSASAAGVIGTLAVFGAVLAAGKVLAKRE